VTTVTLTDARDHLSDLVNRVAYGRERVVLERRGKRLVAIVPVEDLDAIEAAEAAEDAADLAAADAAWAEQGDEPLSNWADVKAELGIGTTPADPTATK